MWPTHPTGTMLVRGSDSVSCASLTPSRSVMYSSPARYLLHCPAAHPPSPHTTQHSAQGGRSIRGPGLGWSGACASSHAPNLASRLAHSHTHRVYIIYCYAPTIASRTPLASLSHTHNVRRARAAQTPDDDLAVAWVGGVVARVGGARRARPQS